MFTSSSRYHDVDTYQVTRPDGTVVTVTRAPVIPKGQIVGLHPRLDGERLDLLAYRYLGDATQGWALCSANNAIVPEALADHDLIAVPKAGS